MNAIVAKHPKLVVPWIVGIENRAWHGGNSSASYESQPGRTKKPSSDDDEQGEHYGNGASLVVQVEHIAKFLHWFQPKQQSREQEQDEHNGDGIDNDFADSAEQRAAMEKPDCAEERHVPVVVGWGSEGNALEMTIRGITDIGEATAENHKRIAMRLNVGKRFIFVDREADLIPCARATVQAVETEGGDGKQASIGSAADVPYLAAVGTLRQSFVEVGKR